MRVGNIFLCRFSQANSFCRAADEARCSVKYAVTMQQRISGMEVMAGIHVPEAETDCFQTTPYGCGCALDYGVSASVRNTLHHMHTRTTKGQSGQLPPWSYRG